MVGTRIFLSIFICNNFIAIYCNFISKAGLINFDLCLLFFVWFWTDIEQYWMYLRVLNKFWMVLNIIQIEWHKKRESFDCNKEWHGKSDRRVEGNWQVGSAPLSPWAGSPATASSCASHASNGLHIKNKHVALSGV